jgi:cytochrome b561
LHWLSVALIAALWVEEQSRSLFPAGSRPTVRSVHIGLGIALVVVLFFRIVWRLTGGRKLPDVNEGLLEWGSTIGHYLLYALAIAALGLGLSLELARGDTIFGLFDFPTVVSGDRALTRALRGYHALAANALVIVACGHAVIALFHHYFLRDGILSRMTPGA